MDSPALRCEKLVKRYGTLAAVDGLDLEIRRGECFGLLGPNGPRKPTTGLDPQSRRQLWDVVLGFKSRGRTVLLTTHYMDEAERLCDRVAVIDKGKVIALGTPQELIAGLGGQQVVELATQQPLRAEELTGLPAVRGARRSADGVAVTVDQLHIALPAILDRVEPLGLTRLSTHQAS